MRHTCVYALLHAVAAMAPLPWGKRPCQDYLKDMRAQTPVVLDDGLVECHPLRHLRWTACVSEEEDADSPLPAQLHSGTPEVNARNSACHAAAAVGVDWTNVLRNAMAYRDGAPVPVVDCTNDWRVADANSLEVVAACACLDRRVLVRRVDGAGVALDLARAAPLFARAGMLVSAHDGMPVSAHDSSDPFLDETRTLVRPECLASTRDLEGPVWPKVLHFAEVLSNLPDDAARRERFGPVPVRRLQNGVWAAGSRHRVAAARLCGVALPCRVVKKGSDQQAAGKGQQGQATADVTRRAALVGGGAVPLSAQALQSSQPLLVHYGGNKDQVADCYLHMGGRRPVVVLLHGGYWRENYGRSLMDAVARDVASGGEFHCVNVEYARGAGSCERASADVALFMEWLAGPKARELGLDAENVALVGHSAGGQLVMRHALRGSPVAFPKTGGGATVRCVVSCGGVLDLREARAKRVGSSAVDDFLGEHGDLRAASPIKLLPPAMTSSLRSLGEWRGVGLWEDKLAATTKLACVHGLDDSVVPAALSTRFIVATATGGVPVEYHQIKREGHFEVLSPTSRSWRATRSIIEEALRAAPATPRLDGDAKRIMAPTRRVDTETEIVITTLRG